MTNMDEMRVLTGPEKAAALLFVMSRPLAIRLLRQFEPGELRLVTQAAASLGTVSGQAIELLAAEMEDRLVSGLDIRGSHGEAQALLAGAFTPDQVLGILDVPSAPARETLWESLAAYDSAALVGWFGTQHPQVVAFLLAKLTSEKVAQVLGITPMPMRSDIMRRLLACGPVAEPATSLCEETLSVELAAHGSSKGDSERPQRLAGILNQMEPGEADAFIVDLALSRPKEAEELRRFLFKFDDLATLSVQARSILLDKVATEKLVLALRGAEQGVRDAVLGCLAARARRIVEAELALEANIPRREVLKAQRAISDLVLSMAQRGEIELHEARADAA